jgi:UDPglucose 6-dehydrogenase
MNNACIIGYGVVGRATAEAFGIKKYYSRSESNITFDEARECKYVFICLPTNVEKGKYVTKDIEEIIEKVGTKENIIILRSTIYPGFTKSIQERLGINIVFNPEFLSEDTAIEDAKHPDIIVIGSEDTAIALDVAAMYAGRFKYIKTVITDSTTAEFIKIGLNGFFTTKVIFANTMYNYAQQTGANYETFKSVLEDHRWGSKNHFQIFHKGGRGAGGKCLRKDMVALRNHSNGTLFMAVDDLNRVLLAQNNKK